MDLLATILTCSLYASDDAVVRAIAEGPSDQNPYFVVNTAAPAEGLAVAPTTEKEALLRSRELIAQGGRLLLGLLEVPPTWIDAFGRSLESAFDPCINIAIGTALLSEFDAECADKVPRRIVARDRVIAEFRPVPYYVVAAEMRAVGGETFRAVWAPGPTAALDPEGRLLSHEAAEEVRGRVCGQEGRVSYWPDGCRLTRSCSRFWPHSESQATCGGGRRRSLADFCGGSRRSRPLITFRLRNAQVRLPLEEHMTKQKKKWRLFKGSRLSTEPVPPRVWERKEGGHVETAGHQREISTVLPEAERTAIVDALVERLLAAPHFRETPANAESPPFMSVDEYARHGRISSRTVRYLVKAMTENVHFHRDGRTGRRVLIHVREADAWRAARKPARARAQDTAQLAIDEVTRRRAHVALRKRVGQ
jgi:hypothetical protein